MEKKEIKEVLLSVEALLPTIELGIESPDLATYFLILLRGQVENILFQGKDLIKAKEYDMYEPKDDGVLICRTLEAACLKFVEDHPDKYHMAMFPEFIRYWSEPNGKGQPRWYSTKTQKNGRFSLPGRLATWAKGFRAPRVETVNPQQNLSDRLKLRVV